MAADELVRLTGGELLRRSGRSIRGGAVDSRTVEPGQVFVALPGERTDGHRFLEHAARAGAAALVVTESLPAARLAALGDISVVRVADGLRALHAIAAGWRARFSPLVIGITGSIAKTSTKEAIAAVVSTRRRTLKNEGNLNNEIGLPLTILRLGPEHEAAVLEMGMYVGGEIADLARLAQPSIGVVTAVQAVHLSRIGSLDAIEAAKGELVEALPRDGIAILNADDERVARMAERTPARSLTYGFDANADVRADDVRSAGFDGMRFVLRATVRGRAVRQPVAIPGLGRLSVHNALAGAAVGLATDIDPEAVAAGLAQGWSAPHRASVRTAGNIRIVDDSYNASPGSVAAALDLLAGLPGRRVAVLGEMLELGSESARGHASVGKAAAATVDLLVVVGNGAHAIVQGARKAGLDAARIVSVEDRAAALDALRSRLRPGDVVLVKASRGVALDLLVDALVAEFGERPR
jgi:UDP-N-acetylmuramoyl-tripeptide--D-alanyl-D-alanine ligase